MLKSCQAAWPLAYFPLQKTQTLDFQAFLRRFEIVLFKK